MTPEQAVLAWFRGVQGAPFQWGVTDCAMLTLEALGRLTGRDYASAYRGLWSCEGEALAHFRREWPSEVLEGLGAREVHPQYRVFGDVVTVPGEPWAERLHFVLGRHSISSHPDRGVGLVPTGLLVGQPGARVWRVAPCPQPSH